MANRKISRDAALAFYQQRPFKRSNTEVTVENGIVSLMLFDNITAYKKQDFNILYFTMAYHGTITTRGRLNALFVEFRSRHRICQKDFLQYVSTYIDNNEISKNIDTGYWYSIDLTNDEFSYYSIRGSIYDTEL